MSTMENAASMLERIGSGVLPAPGEANRMASELRALAAQCVEPVAWMLRHRQTGEWLWDAEACVFGDASAANDRAECENEDADTWEAVPLTAPPSQPVARPPITDAMVDAALDRQSAALLAGLTSRKAMQRALEVAQAAPLSQRVTDEAIERALRTPMGLDHTLRDLIRGDTASVGYSKADVVRALLAALPSQPVALPDDLAAALAELHAALGTPATQGSIGDSPYLGAVKLAAKRLADKPVALPDDAMVERACRAYFDDGVLGWARFAGTRSEKIYRAAMLSALKAALAAAPAGEGVPADTLCRICGQPTMHIGSVCFACSKAAKAAPEVPRG